MKRKSIRFFITLGTLCIFGIMALQIFWVKDSYNLNNNLLEKQISAALANVATRVSVAKKYTLSNQYPVHEIGDDYYAVALEDEISLRSLGLIISSEFDFNNLDIDFEYALYDCKTDSMVYGGHIGENNISLQSQLSKWTESTSSYYFTILLPNRSGYLYKKTLPWILSSVVLLIVVTVFAYALFLILRQKRLSEIQKDFINNMTHELKTPISTIAISAEVLAEDEAIRKDPARLKKYSSIILDENKRLKSQVDKVLQMSLVGQRKFNIQKTEIDLHELIKKVCRNFELVMFQKKGSFQFSLNVEKPIIEADKLHLTDIIYNLLDNAIKYTDTAPEIKITTEQKNKFIKLSIADNGIGMDEKYHKKIFGKFFRVPTGDVHDVKGFGIGLNYVMSIVKAHKWHITLSSEKGKGSVFVIYIPN